MRKQLLRNQETTGRSCLGKPLAARRSGAGGHSFSVGRLSVGFSSRLRSRLEANSPEPAPERADARLLHRAPPQYSGLQAGARLPMERSISRTSQSSVRPPLLQLLPKPTTHFKSAAQIISSRPGARGRCQTEHRAAAPISCQRTSTSQACPGGSGTCTA